MLQCGTSPQPPATTTHNPTAHAPKHTNALETPSATCNAAPPALAPCRHRHFSGPVQCAEPGRLARPLPARQALRGRALSRRQRVGASAAPGGLRGWVGRCVTLCHGVRPCVGGGSAPRPHSTAPHRTRYESTNTPSLPAHVHSTRAAAHSTITTALCGTRWCVAVRPCVMVCVPVSVAAVQGCLVQGKGGGGERGAAAWSAGNANVWEFLWVARCLRLRCADVLCEAVGGGRSCCVGRGGADSWVSLWQRCTGVWRGAEGGCCCCAGHRRCRLVGVPLCVWAARCLQQCCTGVWCGGQCDGVAAAWGVGDADVSRGRTLMCIGVPMFAAALHGCLVRG
jgi:hypothetical protein